MTMPLEEKIRVGASGWFGKDWALSNNHFAGHGPETGAQLISHLRKLP